MSDAREYHQLALNLLGGKGYVLEEAAGPQLLGLEYAYRPPGFPFALAAVYALTGPSVFAGQIFQAALETLICVALYALGKHISSKTTGLLAAACWASYPVSILQPNLLMPEPMLALVCVALLLVSLSRSVNWRTILGAGVLSGVGALVKPFLVLSPVVLFGWMMLERHSLKSAFRTAVLVTAVMVAVIAPWVVRNAVVLGTPVISTNGGVNLWIGNNPGSTGGFRLIEESNPFAGITDEVARDRLGASLAWEFIKNRPLDFLGLVPKKIAHLFSSESPYVVFLNDRSRVSRDTSYAQRYLDTPVLLHIAVNIHYVFYLVVGLFGFLHAPAEVKGARRLFLLFLLFWIGIHAIFFGGHRFHYPLAPLMVLYSAYTVVHLKEIRRQLTAWRLVGALVFTLGFLGILGAEVFTILGRGEL